MNTKINRIEAIPFSLPLERPTRWGATSVRNSADHVLVRVYSNSGLIGMGEATARPTIYGETQVSIVHAIESLFAPLLIGRDANDRVGYWEALDSVPWNPTAKAALDIAIHDILAQEVGVSLAAYMGGALRPIPVSYMLSLGEPKGAVDEALTIREQHGVNAFKVKVGHDPELDVDKIRCLREALGPDTFLFVDANQMYDPVTAIRTLRRMQEFGIAMAEEPLPIHMSRERKRFCETVAVPLLSDESIVTLADLHHQLDLGTVGVLGIKPPRTGIWRTQQILAAAEVFGLSCWIGSQGVSDIGTISSAHVFAAGGARRIPYPADLGTFLRQADHLLEDPLTLSNGCLHLADIPGVGAKVSDAKIQKYRIDA